MTLVTFRPRGEAIFPPMDLTQHKTHDLQAAMLSTLQAAEYWEKEWGKALDVKRKGETFLEWDRCLRAKAAMKAELARRGEVDYDWTAPKPPRGLP